jgi:hypothetical protein
MSDFMDELVKEMNLIHKEMEIVGRNTKKTLDLLVKKHGILEEYEHKAPTLTEEFKINTMRGDIFSQILIFQFKLEFEEDIAKIFSRLDDLETKVKDLSARKKQ